MLKVSTMNSPTTHMKQVKHALNSWQKWKSRPFSVRYHLIADGLEMGPGPLTFYDTEKYEVKTNCRIYIFITKMNNSHYDPTKD